MGESGTPREARPSRIARETFLTEGGPHPARLLSRPAAETARGDLRYGQARGFWSVRGRGHPKATIASGAGPAPARRPATIARTPGQHLPSPKGGREERTGARSPNTPRATRRWGRQRDPPPTERERSTLSSLPPRSPERSNNCSSPSGTRLRNPRRRGETDSEAAAGRGSGTGTGNSTHRLSLRHLRKRPGAPQEHRSRGAPSRRRGTAAALPDAGRATRTALGRPERAAGGKHPLRQRTPGARSRPGSAPPPFPAPRTGGEGRRGARGQDEKSWPIRHECPSLAWRGFGPAQESAKSPHRSAGWAGETRGAGGDPARTASRGACYGLAGPTPQGERPTTRNGERLTRGSEPWKRASSSHRPRRPQRGAHGR